MYKKSILILSSILMLESSFAIDGESHQSNNKRPLPTPPQKSQSTIPANDKNSSSSINANRPLPVPPQKVQKVNPAKSEGLNTSAITDKQDTKEEGATLNSSASSTQTEKDKNSEDSPKEQFKKRGRANAVLVPEKDLIPAVSFIDSQMLEDQNKADREKLAQLQKQFNKFSSKTKSEVENLYKLTTSDREDYFKLKESTELTPDEAKSFKDIQLREEQRKKFKAELDILNDINQYKKFISPVDDRTLTQHLSTNQNDLDKMAEAQNADQRKLAELSSNDPEKLKFINRTGMRAIEIMNRKAHIQLANKMLKKDSQERETFRVFDFYRQLIGKTYHVNSYKRVTSLEE
jgi:hypothetical protein